MEEIHILKKCTKLCNIQWNAVTSQVIIREYLYCNLNEKYYHRLHLDKKNSSDCGIFVCKVINAINKI